MGKVFLFVQIPLALLMYAQGCQQESRPVATVTAVTPITQLQDTVSMVAFETDVLPILKAKCSPCHFEGGKMFQRMPFTDAKTIISHSGGVLKRFKEPEQVTIKAYLDQVKK